MNRAVFTKVFSRCQNVHDVEVFHTVLTQKINKLNRPDKEKSSLIQILGEVAKEWAIAVK